MSGMSHFEGIAHEVRTKQVQFRCLFSHQWPLLVTVRSDAWSGLSVPNLLIHKTVYVVVQARCRLRFPFHNVTLTIFHRYLEDWLLLQIPLELNSIRPFPDNPFLMRYWCMGKWQWRIDAPLISILNFWKALSHSVGKCLHETGPKSMQALFSRSQCLSSHASFFWNPPGV